MIRLEYFIDFKSPAAYLSLQPTLDLLEEYTFELLWRPYRSLQKAVPAKADDETKGETHIRVRAAARQQTHLKYAALRNLPMKFPADPGNTDLALAGLLAADKDPTTYAQLAFDAYWVENLDLSDERLVRKLLADSGHDPQTFDAAARLAELEDAQIPSEERGVVDTPAYLIEEQIFIGREHLPWIRELLAGHAPGCDPACRYGLAAHLPRPAPPSEHRHAPRYGFVHVTQQRRVGR
jgi:2-hydroxychromene-2-carboxylate isomerase